MQSTPPVRATHMLLPHRLQHAFFLVFMVTTIVKNYCKLCQISASSDKALCRKVGSLSIKCQNRQKGTSNTCVPPLPVQCGSLCELLYI